MQAFFKHAGVFGGIAGSGGPASRVLWKAWGAITFCFDRMMNTDILG